MLWPALLACALLFRHDLSMSTVTKKDLVDRITDATELKQTVVGEVVQTFLDNLVVELGKGNRLEFRDFGVFEVKHRKARTAQNPKTLEPVRVSPNHTVKFKPGRLMKKTVAGAARQRRRKRSRTLNVS